MTPSSRVSVYEVTEKPGRTRPFLVRRRVGGVERSSSFATRAQARAFHARLLSASLAGEPFDPATGEPAAWHGSAGTPTVLAFARTHLGDRWGRMAATTRRSAVEALATALPALVARGHRTPDRGLLYRALMASLRGGDLTPRQLDAVRWLEGASLPIGQVGREQATRALDALALTLTSAPASATTVGRKRAVLYGLLRAAVAAGHLPANPLDAVDWRPERVAQSVDRRRVGGPREVAGLLAAVGGGQAVRYRLYLALLFYAGLRPSEGVALRVGHVELPPDDGAWGTLWVRHSAPVVGTAWTDGGEARDPRQLKHRGRDDVRQVPIPPALVGLLRPALQGRPAEALVVATATGGPLQASGAGEALRDARARWAAQVAAETGRAPAPEKLARPYDLRHSAATLWLNAGVPAPEVAHRLGHGVDVLLRVYAGCIEEHRAEHNARIEAALG